MASVERDCPSCVDGGQDLLPGIPDHITMQHIAPKLLWETCNVLQVVSRGWQHVIHNRSVYNARVRSKSTEAFIVVVYFYPDGKIILTLYSCSDDFVSRRLPPVPAVHPKDVDCICLDGRVYLWVRTADIGSTWWRAYVLDLAGDRKWTQRKSVEHSISSHPHGYGVLDGKIYRFGGNTHSHRGVLEGGTFGESVWSIESQVARLPRTELYDPSSDVWSVITPEPARNGGTFNGNAEGQLDFFSKWLREQLAADPSKIF